MSKLYFLLFFISLNLFAQLPNGLGDKLINPRQTMQTFMDAMERVKKGDSSAIKEAILTLDLSSVDPALKNLVGKTSAEHLVSTIDRISKVNYLLIPNDINGPKWFFRKETVSLYNKNYDVEIAIAKSADGAWRFSSDTVLSIDNFYSSVSHLKVVEGVDRLTNWRIKVKDRMPAWMGNEAILLKNGQWVALFILFFLSLITNLITRKIIRGYFSDQKKDSTSEHISTLPFGLLAFSLTWFLGVRVLEFDFEILAIFIRASYIMMAFFAVWSSLHLVDFLSYYAIKKYSKTKNKFDDVLIPLLKKATKVLVVSLGAVLIAHSLTFDIASILAGLGIGGVAVALAAKDTIANIFGSVTVLIDRPFDIGDYVILEKGVEGSVEQVGFRSTRVRTPYNSVVTVPNSILANMSIDNYGMRHFRRFKTTLFVKHETPTANIEDFCNRLRIIIQLNPLMAHELGQVYINDIGERSINILVNVFFTTDKAVIEMEERQKLICEILKLAAELKIQFVTTQYI